jgi:hypothetical protein
MIMPVWLTILIAVLDLIIAAAAVWGIGKKVEKRIIDKNDADRQRDADIAEALCGVRSMPKYRQQSIEIQKELKDADEEILKTCATIQAGVTENQKILVERLDKLESRERNALRAKILDMHRLFTSKQKNPMQSWTEMERDAFFDLIRDYESLDGNGHVHKIVIPEMNMLDVVPMSDKQAIEELFHSRKA